MVCGGAKEQTLALVFFLEKNTVSSQLKLNFFPYFLEKIVSVDNSMFEKTTNFEGPNTECLITLKRHKILEVDMCKRDHFKSRGIKRMQLPLLKNRSVFVRANGEE